MDEPLKSVMHGRCDSILIMLGDRGSDLAEVLYCKHSGCVLDPPCTFNITLGYVNFR